MAVNIDKEDDGDSVVVIVSFVVVYVVLVVVNDVDLVEEDDENNEDWLSPNGICINSAREESPFSLVYSDLHRNIEIKSKK